jgi:hypothetical protein
MYDNSGLYLKGKSAKCCGQVLKYDTYDMENVYEKKKSNKGNQIKGRSIIRTSNTVYIVRLTLEKIISLPSI